MQPDVEATDVAVLELVRALSVGLLVFVCDTCLVGGGCCWTDTVAILLQPAEDICNTERQVIRFARGHVRITHSASASPLKKDLVSGGPCVRE